MCVREREEKITAQSAFAVVGSVMSSKEGAKKRKERGNIERNRECVWMCRAARERGHSVM